MGKAWVPASSACIKWTVVHTCACGACMVGRTPVNNGSNGHRCCDCRKCAHAACCDCGECAITVLLFPSWDPDGTHAMCMHMILCACGCSQFNIQVWLGPVPRTASTNDSYNFCAQVGASANTATSSAPTETITLLKKQDGTPLRVCP